MLSSDSIDFMICNHSRVALTMQELYKPKLEFFVDSSCLSSKVENIYFVPGLNENLQIILLMIDGDLLRCRSLRKAA